MWRRMERKNLIAITSFKYAGERFKPGDSFTAPRAHARAFIAIKRAKSAPDVPANAPENSPREEPPSDPAAYETTAMVAETPEHPAESSPRRRYRTRQMTPKP